MRRLQEIQNYFHNFKKNPSIKKSFIIFMLIATLLPLSIGSLTSYQISNQMIQAEVSNFNTAWIAKQKDYMELLLQNIESMMDNIANIDSIKNVLERKSGSTDDYTSLSTQAMIGYILSGYNIDGLLSIDLISMDGAHYHVGETLNFQKINYNTKATLDQLALISPDSVVWAGLEDNINENSTHRKVISAAKLIKKIDSDTLEEVPVGLLIISYDIDSFYNHFVQSNLNKNSTFMIVGQDREILFHPDKQKIGAVVNQKFLDKLTGDSGDFIETIDGEKMFVVYSNSERYKWSVLSYIPVDRLTERTKPIMLYSLVAALLCFLLVSAYGWNLSRRVLTPMNQITLTFKEIRADNADLTKRLEVTSHDEVGELVKWFNAFLENLQEKRIMEEELRIANEKLEIRVRERTLDLETLNTELHKRTIEIQDALEKLKTTQNQLIQREKLAGIGQLAAGVAHEINNPLGYVSSNMISLGHYVDTFKELLKQYQYLATIIKNEVSGDALRQLTEIKKYEDEHSLDYIINDLDDLLVDVNNGLERVEKIVKSLRMFSWTEKEAVFDAAYDLNKGIENSLLIAQNEIKYVAAVEQHLGELPLIEAIGSEINQVILNILVNAAQAIKMKAMDTQGLIRINTWHDEESVYCEIKDNGIGISSEYISHIFNPFFTTKPVGEGTGLGLSISYDIVVNQHHGQIFCEGEDGTGATFRMILPIQQKR